MTLDKIYISVRIIMVINMSHIKLNFEIRAVKSIFKPNLRLIQLKLRKLGFLGVMIHRHENDITDTKC